jgi:hypothetical protein
MGSFRQDRKAECRHKDHRSQAFSGMPLAAIAEQGAKTVQMPTGSQRPIIVLKLVG